MSPGERQYLEDEYMPPCDGCFKDSCVGCEWDQVDDWEFMEEDND